MRNPKKSSLISLFLLSLTACSLIAGENKSSIDEKVEQSKRLLRKLTRELTIVLPLTSIASIWTIYYEPSKINYWITGISWLSFFKNLLRYNQTKNELKWSAYQRIKERKKDVIEKFTSYITDFNELISAPDAIVQLAQQKKRANKKYDCNLQKAQKTIETEFNYIRIKERSLSKNDQERIKPYLNDLSKVQDAVKNLNTIYNFINTPRLTDEQRLNHIKKLIKIQTIHELNENTVNNNFIDYYTTLQNHAQQDILKWQKRNKYFNITASIGITGIISYELVKKYW